MRVVIAPDKFKGSLSAHQVCEAITEGIHAVDTSIEVVAHPLADGGEGSLDLLINALKLRRVDIQVNDPLFRPVNAYYGYAEGRAFVEMAIASGLPLLSEGERDPLQTSTYGTGELIRDAIDRGAKEVYLMIGGSATNDGGAGMAEALGFRFYGSEGEIKKLSGQKLLTLEKVGGHLKSSQVRFFVLTDVQNLLLGPDGTTQVYGPQKGASADALIQLEKGLSNLAETMKNGCELVPGSGAAGGLGYGALSFLAAKLQPGINTIMNITDFESVLDQADLLITGEGKVDAQTLAGKVVAGVASKSRLHHIPLAIVCGMVENEEEVKAFSGTNNIYPLKTDSISTSYAMEHAFELLKEKSTQLMRELLSAN